MNALLNLAGWVVLLIVIVHKAATYKTQWVRGPKYGMPVHLLAPDGQHYADGNSVYPFDLWIISTGYEEEWWIGIVGTFGVGLGLLTMHVRREMRARKILLSNGKRIDMDDAGLDRILLKWNRHDVFTRRHLLNGGVLIFGRPGSGKTSGSGVALGRNIAGDPLASMLILAAKPEDKQMWQQMFAEKKRELMIFEPEGNLRCNMIDFIQRCGADSRQIAEFLLVSAEVLRGENKGGGEYGTFFQDEEQRFFHHAIDILRHAGVPVSAPNLQRFIDGAALSPEQRNSDAWRAGFHNGCLRAAATRETSPDEKDDVEMANTAWSTEWVLMADKTRSCVLAGMKNTLFFWNLGIARRLMSTTTNCCPLDMLQGKSILVNCPSSEYGPSGALISTCWKYLTQKVILARQFTPGQFYSIVWADEAWQVTTSFDQHYAATSRSHGGAMVYLAQSRDSFYSALKGEDGKNFANALLGMFHHKVFHALGSPDDAEYASSLLGRRRETSFGGNVQPAGDCFDAAFGHLLGQSRAQTSFNESWQPILQPAVFQNGLRTGGKENKGLVDGIVVRSGEPFKSTNQNFIFATFQQ